MAKVGNTPTKFRCCVCGLSYAVELKKTSKGKNYCQDCWDKKETARLKLTDYIQKLLDDSGFSEDKDDRKAFWGMVGAQMRLYTDEKKDYNYNYKSILYTLKFIYEYDENPPDFVPELGIGNVPFYYLRAKMFCVKEHELNLLEKGKEAGDIVPETITINRSDLIAQEERETHLKMKRINREEDVDLASITEDMFDTSDIDKELKESGIWGDE